MIENLRNQNTSNVRFSKLDALLEDSPGSVPIYLGAKLRGVEIRNVDEFPSPGAKKDDDQGRPLALRYPGDRPEGSFSLNGQQISPVDISTRLSDEGAAHNQANFYINVEDESAPTKVGSYEFSSKLIYNINDVLRSLEALPIERRYPVIAFGSNANPGQLAQKFKELDGADKDIVPTLHASVNGMVPVYVARIGLNGYVFTDLYPTNNEKAECEVFINFLTPAQLEAMDATEGAYSLCEVPNVTIRGTASEETIISDAYLYVGKVKINNEGPKGAGILADNEGRPIRLAELNASGEGIDEEFAAMTQSEVQSYLHEVAGVHVAKFFRLEDAPNTTDDIIRMITNRQKDERLSNFRKWARGESEYKRNGKFLLGRAMNEAIQNAIKDTGRTMPEISIRSRIPEEKQDLSLDKLRTFGELIS
jgi:hypothetical protein